MQTEAQYLVLVRHGESEANAALAVTDDRLYYQVPGTDLHVPLTEKGREQALMCGKILARWFADKPFARAWVSPFRRVQDTLTAIEQTLGYTLPRLLDERLAKRAYGQFWNLTHKGVAVLYPEEYTKFLETGALAYRPPDGENYYDLFARVEQFIAESIIPSQGNTLIVAHSAVVLAFQRVLEGLPDCEVVRRYDEMELPNGHIQVYARQDASRPWAAMSWHNELVA